jgi:hypothetical protein
VVFLQVEASEMVRVLVKVKELALELGLGKD